MSVVVLNLKKELRLFFAFLRFWFTAVLAMLEQRGVTELSADASIILIIAYCFKFTMWFIPANNIIYPAKTFFGTLYKTSFPVLSSITKPISARNVPRARLISCI